MISTVAPLESGHTKDHCRMGTFRSIVRPLRQTLSNRQPCDGWTLECSQTELRADFTRTTRKRAREPQLEWKSRTKAMNYDEYPHSRDGILFQELGNWSFLRREVVCRLSERGGASPLVVSWSTLKCQCRVNLFFNVECRWIDCSEFSARLLHVRAPADIVITYLYPRGMKCDESFWY